MVEILIKNLKIFFFLHKNNSLILFFLNSSNNNSDDMEQLISVPSLVHKNEHSGSYRNVKVTCNNNNNSSNKSYTNSSGSSNRYSFVPSNSSSNSSNGKQDACLDSFNSSSEDLNDAVWFQPNMPRENVQIFLSNKEIGSFVIRLSNTCRDCFALSIRVPYFANQNGIAHYLIVRNNKGYKLKGVDKEFKSLKSLVTHYSVMQGKIYFYLIFFGLFYAYN